MAIIAIANGVVLLFVFLWMSINLYQKCAANQAMIISGWGATQQGRSYKIIVGGGDVVLPMLQQVTRLSLEVMPIKVESQTPIIMKDGIPLFVSATAQIKVPSDYDSIAAAAERFIGKSQEEISKLAQQILEGGMRAVLARMTAAELISNFDKATFEFQQYVKPELAKLGLACLVFSIREIKDNVGYLEALAGPETAELKKKAEIEILRQKKETTAATMETEVEIALLSELPVDPLKRIALANEYDQMLPVLEKTLGGESLVFKDFLMRYAMVLAGKKDPLSLSKAEELMVRARKIGAPTQLV